jgi:hypothetical protein
VILPSVLTAEGRVQGHKCPGDGGRCVFRRSACSTSPSIQMVRGPTFPNRLRPQRAANESLNFLGSAVKFAFAVIARLPLERGIR